MVTAQAKKKTTTRAAKKDVYKLYSKALESVHKGAYKTALTTIARIQKNFSTEIDVVAKARSLAAVCERRLKKDTGSVSGLSAEDLFDRGVYHHNRGEFDQATELFNKALRKDPKAGYAHYALAASEAAQGNASEAISHLEKAIATNNESRFHALNDPDFSGLREDELFRQLVAN